MKKIQTVTTLAVAGAMSLGAAAAGASVAAASPKVSSVVNTSAKCTKGSVGNLQVQREDTGQLSIDMGVDMSRHVSGVPWKVKAYDNGSLIANATVRTVSDGSFSITRLISPKAGSNHVVFYATNLRTGETCRLNGTV
jgi:hypothetical protein